MTPAAAVASRAAAAREAAVAPASAVAPSTAFEPDAADDSDELYYPPWDGRPVGETSRHADVIDDARFALKNWFRPHGGVYVGRNLFVHYEQGNPDASVAPDLFVVRGAGNRNRTVWKIWEEGGRGPEFVLEVTSRSTRRRDRTVKPGIYRTLGVEEYFQFDPLEEDDPALLGLRLVDGEYEPLTLAAPRRPKGGRPGLHSEVLGLELYVEEDGTLRFRDPQTGKRLPTEEEEWEGRLEAEAGRREAESRLAEAEARVRELEARLRSRPG